MIFYDFRWKSSEKNKPLQDTCRVCHSCDVVVSTHDSYTVESEFETRIRHGCSVLLLGFPSQMVIDFRRPPGQCNIARVAVLEEKYFKVYIPFKNSGLFSKTNSRMV